ncbi:efflux transporter outer membrane subunit [Colwelliaceae bacterium BS250]
MKKLSLISFAYICLHGCTLGPEYEEPDTSTSNITEQTTWQEDDKDAQTVNEVKWRNLYQDPGLTPLIEKALQNNIDLKIATERMLRSGNAVTSTDADLLPQVSAQFFGDREQLSPQYSTSEDIVDDYRMLGKVSWEVDLWGKLRRNSESALANFQADQADYYGARISLIAEVANQYYAIQDIKEQIKLTQSNILARTKSKRIAELRHQQGVISGLDVSQSHVELVTEKLKLPALNSNLKSAMYRLSILVGEAPKTMVLPERALNTQIYQGRLAGGLSSSLLKRRPDIVAQERRLQAANADIGAAETDYFPNIVLNGYYGGKSSELDDVLDNAETWLLGFDVTMPIFTWGKTKANIDNLESQYREVILNYQYTVLNAFRETAEAFEAFEQTQVEHELKLELVSATKENMRIAKLRYSNGSVSYLDVLDAQRNLADAEADFSSAINLHQSAFINLYKTLGGGWDSESFEAQIRPPEDQTAVSSETTSEVVD